jgi:predicted house-cleaning noncanonical NTP pyrophosphatase (MazG superfamily)
LYERYRDIAEHAESLVLEQVLTSYEQAGLEFALREVAPSKDDYVIVRSSATQEDISSRGRYRTEVCRATTAQLGSAISKVFASCATEMGTTMGIIVQQYIRTRRASGHLSNERRVSRKISSWVSEFEAVSGAGPPRILRLSSQGVKPPGEDQPLMCTEFQYLREILREVGAYAQLEKLHLHLEWIWDGSRLWLVQADQTTHTRSRRTFGAKPKMIRASKPGPLSVLVPEEDVPKGIWSKLDCVKTFRKCGLPTTNFWVLNEKSVLAQLGNQKHPSKLRRDLKALLDAPVVIRTDVAQEYDPVRLLLPRTETVSDVETAENFLVTVTREMKQELKTEGKLCFIIHRFIPARSSAFSVAAPQKHRVRIDGIWGLPDGLAFYSHDSYDLASDGLGKIYKRIRCKQNYLDLDRKGRWVPKHLGAPDDWKSALTDGELREIAKGTCAIAEALNAPAQVMWFVGIPEGVGHPPCIPWYYTTQELPKTVIADKRAVIQREPLIRRREDLDILRSEPEESKSITRIRLRPVPELLRSKEFIEDVAVLANSLGVAVVIEGSILSHAYYLLKNSGAKVICSDPFAPPFQRKAFHKLVRDLIPVKIRSRGEKAKVIRVTGDQFISLLKAKAVEEALELFWSDTSEQDKDEMVDLLEVIRALCRSEGASNDDIDMLAQSKRAKRGGFLEGFVLEETQEVPLFQLATNTPKLFPEIESDDEELDKHEPRELSKVRVGAAPRVEGPHVIIPLVPPHPQHRHLSHIFTIRGTGISLNLRFREKDVVIEVSANGGKVKTSEIRQLTLFDS